MNKIQYIIGDATEPVGDGPKIIAHCCNDIGKWGRGFVVALSQKWRAPEEVYRKRWKETKPGKVQFVHVGRDITVCNIIGQHGIWRDTDGQAPIRYEWIRSGFQEIYTNLPYGTPSVHMPRIGCGLAGGEWSKIEKIIEEELCAKGIPVYVYDLR